MTKPLLLLSAVLFVCLSGTALSQSSEVEVYRNGRWVKLGSPEVGAGGLEAAREYLRQGDFNRTVRLCKQIIKEEPDPNTVLAARMLLGDCWLLLDEMTDARLQYDAVLTEAPVGSAIYDLALEREYEVAYMWVVGGRNKKVQVFGIWIPLLRIPGKSEGLKLLGDMRLKFPKPDLSARTWMLSAEHFFSRNDFDAAIPEYSQVVERFPNSPYAITAELQAINSLIGTFKGTEYDLTPLGGPDGARGRLADFRSTHPSAAKQFEVDLLIQRIDWLYAQRDYEAAEFYERLGNIRSSVILYRTIARRAEFAATPWRDRSLVRLSKLGVPEP